MTAAAHTSRRGWLARWSGLSLSSRIIVGLVLGVLIGLFFGEGAAALQPVADVYIRLMQMTVLPYLVLALIIGLGQLSAMQAKRLAARMGVLLLLFCGLALVIVAAMPMAFPVFGTRCSSRMR